MDHETDIRQRFFNALKRGTGETYLLQKEHPGIDFSREITKGALRNFAYDPQCEGSRATYIYGLIRRCPRTQRDNIERQVLRRLRTQQGDYYGLAQLCDLAVLFFKGGNPEAQQALNDRFGKNVLEDYECCGLDQLIEMEGLAGLLKVAEFVGEILLADPDDSENSYRADRFQQQNKGIDVYAELEKAGRHNPCIQAYYQSICRHKWSPWKRIRRKKATYASVRESIVNGKSRFIGFGKSVADLSEAEVARLANDFLNETDKHIQARYLMFFMARKFPFDYQPLLKIARGKNPGKTRLVKFALEALQYFRAGELREFALQQMTKRKNPCDYLYLLVGSYQAGDAKRVNEVIQRSAHYDYVHSMVSAVINIYRANPVKECKEPLESIYAAMNCGLHRLYVLEVLQQNHALSAQLLREMQYDSYERIRALYRKLSKTAVRPA